MYGSPDISFVSGESTAYKQISLFDTVTATRGSSSGTRIGVARARSIEYSGGTAGDVEFINGTPESGTTLFKSRTIGTANTVIDRTIPSEGVLFQDGASIKYTLDVADMITIFHA